MRQFLLSATLATFTGLTALPAAGTFVERLPVRDVELADLTGSPKSFLNTRVRFNAVFIDTPGIYDPIHTPYSPERYVNIAVWDDEARLYDPKVRAVPLVTVYADKQLADRAHLTRLSKYQAVEIIGDIASVSRGLPWVNVHSIRPIDGAKAYTDNAIYHVEQAMGLAKENAFELADARFATALTEDLPPNAVVAIHEIRARNAMNAGWHVQAADHLRKALAIAQDKPATPIEHASAQEIADLHYLLAKSLGEVADEAEGDARSRAFEEAVAHARKGLAIDPKNGDAYAVLGISLAGLGRFDEARRECAQAIRLQPNNAEVRWYLGRILDSQGQFDEAIEALKKAIDLTPKDHRIHKAIAAAYFHRAQAGSTSAPEDYTTAVREYDIALRLRPDDADSSYESGVVLRAAAEAKTEVQLGNERTVATVEHAIARFQGALAIAPQHVPSLLALADIYQKQGKTTEAMAILTDLCAAAPDQIQAFLQLAQLQVAGSKHDEAMATLETYRATHPNDSAILANIGRLALVVGKPEAGVAALEQLTKAEPDNASAQLDLAECYLATGRARDAVRRAKLAARTDDADLAAKAQDCLARAQAAGG